MLAHVHSAICILSEAVLLVELILNICDGSLRLLRASYKIQFLRYVIYPLPRGVIALKSIAVGQTCKLHDTDATTAFTSESVLHIFTLHEFVAEATLHKVEIEAV